MHRIPVRFKGKPLMSMKSSKAKKFIESGKGKVRYDRKLKVHYLQLLVDPSGEEIQPVKLGIDDGSMFDGFTVLTKLNHLLNIELIQREKYGKPTKNGERTESKISIKTFKVRQKKYRKVRRDRLRHRPIRFSNRTKSKLPPTIQANVDFRIWLIKRLIRIYPISKACIEDCKFNTQEFPLSPLVMLGKTKLYEFINSLGIELEFFSGIDTWKLRCNTFGFDPKPKGLETKGDKKYESHCLDSTVLACDKDFEINYLTGEVLEDIPVAIMDFKVNTTVTYIKRIVKVRRALRRYRKVYASKYKNPLGPNYYKKLKGGVKVPYVNMSNKSNKCRVKLPGEHSNHPKKWEYIDNGRDQKFKHLKKDPYGGTTLNGKTFFINGEWSNREVEKSY